MNPEQRHRAREAALQILYQWQVGKRSVDAAAETFFALQWPDDEARPVDALVEWATSLAAETVQRLAEIDTLVADTSERWRPERMAIIDRLILRMAVCEMQRDSVTPAAVIINEALELARTFSGEEAVKFINGMLDAIRGKLER